MKRRYVKNGIGALACGIALIALAAASSQFFALADSTQGNLGQGIWFVKAIMLGGGLLVAFALACFVFAVSRSDK